MDINERFGQSNGCKYIQLQREISSTFQGSSDIATYFTKMRSLWDELNSAYVGPLPKFIEDQYLFQFLSGLNDSYSIAKSSILMMSLYPSISKAYSLLQQDESQKETHLSWESSYSPIALKTFEAPVHGFSKEQYSHLMTLLQQTHISPNYTPASPAANSSGYAYFAGVSYLPVEKMHSLAHSLSASFNSGPSLKRPLKIGKEAHGFYFLLPDMPLLSAHDSSVDSSNASSALSILKTFTSMVKVHFNYSIQSFRSDNAYEAKTFFAHNGILHQTTIPHTPQQNGVIERKHKHLLETSRALLFQFNLPTKYWGDCVLTATYLINRLPYYVLDNSSPIEKLHDTPPSYDHLRSFGCLCFTTTPKPGRDKFQSRAIASVFIGYPCGKKGYKLLNLSNHSILFSRDVQFHESIFPNSSSLPSSIFPVSFPDSSDIPASSSPIISPSLTPGFTSEPTPSSTPPTISPISRSNSPISLFSSTSSPLPVPSIPLFRKSTRVHQPPAHLADYVCNSALPSASLSTQPKVLSTDMLVHEPQFYQQAVSRHIW
ncbi:uncharacterized protein [Nicotiana tomentosiformis]|uniref:uncharacterized protein n=1 Tax=Nicotiana tomentosiformis TaxID=4098 RepID=UPI00388C8D34